jgi:hypothetical protein
MNRREIVDLVVIIGIAAAGIGIIIYFGQQ